MPVSTPISVRTEAAVRINASKRTMFRGDTYNLKIIGTNKKVTWRSSNKTVAIVTANGRVTAKRKGTATITGIVGKQRYNCKVTVKTGLIKFVKKSVSVNVGKTVTVWVDTKKVDELVMSSADDKAKFDWGDWKGTSCAIRIKGIIPGAASLKVYYDKDKSVQDVLKITVKPNVSNTYGTVRGNITYHYNSYRGYVPDTNSMVFLIPKNKNAMGSNILYTQFISLSPALLKKYVYSAKVDGNGNYVVNHVPTGQYRIVVVSQNSTAEEYFKASDINAFYSNRGKIFKNVLNDFSAYRLSKTIGMYKWAIGSVNVYRGEQTFFSHAFGYTYF